MGHREELIEAFVAEDEVGYDVDALVAHRDARTTPPLGSPRNPDATD